MKLVFIFLEGSGKLSDYAWRRGQGRGRKKKKPHPSASNSTC